MDPAVKRRFTDSLERLRRVNPHSLAFGGERMHFPEFVALMRLRELRGGGGGAVGAGDIRRELRVSGPAISQALGSLERRGLIRREIDGGDRRKIAVTLTRAGEAACESAARRHDAVLSALIERFGEEDTRAFGALLERFMDVLEEYSREYRERELPE